jgi:hypothetical protein
MPRPVTSHQYSTRFGKSAPPLRRYSWRVGIIRQYFRGVATHGMSEAFAEIVRRPTRPEGGGVHEKLLRGEILIHVLDLTEMPMIAPAGRAAVEAGSRTVLIVALRRDAALLGYITAHRTEVRPFTDKQIALLQNFAAQAVIAMENVRLISETREALEQQTETAEVLGVINASPGDLVPVFEAIVDKATRLCGAAFGALRTFDGKLFQLGASRGGDQAEVERLRKLGPIDPAARPPTLSGRDWHEASPSSISRICVTS